MAREVIFINVGQAGLQIGDASWKLFCLEHGIKPDGSMDKDDSTSSEISSFFSESSKGKQVPRSLMIDLEPTVIDMIRTGGNKSLYHQDQMIAGKEDAANNFARGRYTVGRDKLDACMECIRKMADHCDSLQGFLVSHSSGGGTGSGFTSLLFQKLVDEFGKINKLQLAVYPAPQIASAVVEPYNSILLAHNTMDTTDCAFMVDNEAIYDIAMKRLGILRPDLCQLNSLVAQVLSSITLSMRFEGSLNTDLNEFQTNLVPYPRIHFPMASYAPITTVEKEHHERFSIDRLTSDCFDPSNQLLKCNTRGGKFIACCLLYRGDVTPGDVNTATSAIKKRTGVNFVEWSPTGFKVGMNNQRPYNINGSTPLPAQRAVCMMANSTAIVESWKKMNAQFDLMFNKRAFVHWFVSEGMEEDELNQARTDLAALEEDYENISHDYSSIPNEDEY